MIFLRTALVFSILLLGVKPSFAACSNNEDGQPGQKNEIEFFTPENVFRYCDGTSWIDMYSAGAYKNKSAVNASCSEPAALSTQLSVHYNFEDGSGSSLLDQQGALNGTLYNFNTTTAWVAGKENDFALDFDGADDWVGFSTSANANLDTITASFWIKPDVVTSAKNGIAIIENRAGGANVNYEVSIDGSGNGTSNDGRVKIAYYNGGWRNIVSSITPVAGQWQHIAFTIDASTNTYTFYFNGVLADSSTTSADLNASYSDLTLALGKSDDTTNNDYFNGQMDSVRLYSRALSASEVKNIYLQEGGDCATLIGHWNFDETSGTDIADSSAISNTGAYTGADISNDTIPGVFMAALDMSNDNPVSIPSSNAYGNLEKFSVSFWIKTTGTVTSSQGLFDVSDLFSIRNRFNGDDIQFIAQAWNTNGTWTTTTGELSTADWAHIVITYDYSSTANTPKFYYNGAEITSGIQQNNSPTDPASLPTSPNMLIGRRLDSTASKYEGAIDDVRIYNTILSPTEISEIHNQTATAYSTGLVGYWTLDETFGTSVGDSSSIGNILNMQGTMTGAANTITGPVGSAFTFDGNNDYLANNSPSGLPNGDDAFTIATWVKSYTLGDRDLLIGWGEQVNGRASILAIQPPTGYLRYTAHGSGYDWDSSATITPNTWHHVAVTHEDGANEVKFYLDGQYVDTVSNPNGININQDVLQIGNAPTTNDPLDGELDDVRIYNYALTAGEIATLSTCHQGGILFYNYTSGAIQFCGSTTTAYNIGTPASGSGGCGSAVEGTLEYNEATQNFEFCDGSGWVALQ